MNFFKETNQKKNNGALLLPKSWGGKVGSWPVLCVSAHAAPPPSPPNEGQRDRTRPSELLNCKRGLSAAPNGCCHQSASREDGRACSKGLGCSCARPLAEESGMHLWPRGGQDDHMVSLLQLLGWTGQAVTKDTSLSLF